MANSKLTILSCLPSSSGCRSFSQPQLPAKMAHSSRNPGKSKLLVKRQNVGSLICRNCPYRSNSREILDLHEHVQHSATNLSFKCSFCTFTAKTTLLILNHIKLEHSEKKDKVFKVMFINHKNKTPPKKVASPAKGNVKVVSKSTTDGIIVKHVGKKRDPPVKTPPKQPKLNKSLISKTTQEVINVQVNDIAKEIAEIDRIPNESEDESKLWCTCRQPFGKRFMICCDGCDDWFHGSCVSITPAKNKQLNADCVKWFCPHCARKDSILNHHAKVTQAMTSLSTQFIATGFQIPLPPKDLSTPLPEDGHSDEPPNLNDNLLSHADEVPSSPPDLQYDREILRKEETICLMEMEKLTEDIRTAHEALVKQANVLKENYGPAILITRARRIDELHRTIKQLEMKDRGYSLEQSVLIEFKERGQQRLKELTSQKNQLKKELKPLKEVSVNKKIKLEISSANPSVIEEMIRQKETFLYDVKVNLLDILKEDNDFTTRIRVVEEELADNTRKLEQMRAELDSLQRNPADDGLPSSNALQMKHLKKKQRDRIAELSRLKKRLVQISCGYVIEEINRKEEEGIKTLDDYDKN